MTEINAAILRGARVEHRHGAVMMEADAIRRWWNGEYSAGQWAYLRDRVDSLDRVQIAGGWINHFGARRVLDVGCGQGQLLKALDPAVVRSYLGIDVSEVALNDTVSRNGIDAQYRVLEAQSEDLPSDYIADCICLIDVPYYFERPETTLIRLFRHLAPDGFVIICMWVDPAWIAFNWKRWYRGPRLRGHNRSARRVWSFIDRHTGEIMDAVRLMNVKTRDLSILRAFRPLRA